MKPITLVAVFAVLLTACGASTSSTSSPAGTTTLATTTSTTTTRAAPTTTQATTTTAATTTTTQATTSTTAVTATGPFTVATYGLFPPVFMGSNDAQGSGCAPGTDTLPDGIWFGYVRGVTDTSLSFDLACFWVGQAAVDHSGDAEVADGYYIGNDSPALRTVPRDPSGTAYWIDANSGMAPQPVPMADWPVVGGNHYVPCPGQYCGVWLYINNGVATELVEQYVP